MDWILLIGSIVCAWVILSILANERQGRITQREQVTRQAASAAAQKAREITVVS